MAANGPVTEAELIAREVADRDVPCPRCRYNLRGVRSNTCPECGTRLSLSRLRFAGAHWRTRCFFVGLAGLAFTLVPLITGVVLIMRASQTLGWMDDADRGNTAILGILFALNILLIRLWINWASAMAAWPRWRHALLAGVCCSVAPASAASLLLSMRLV